MRFFYEMPANALSSSLADGFLVKRLTSGTTPNGTIMASDDAIGDLSGPQTKKNMIASENPVSIPALAPHRVVPFQNSP